MKSFLFLTLADGTKTNERMYKICKADEIQIFIVQKSATILDTQTLSDCKKNRNFASNVCSFFYGHI